MCWSPSKYDYLSLGLIKNCISSSNILLYAGLELLVVSDLWLLLFLVLLSFFVILGHTYQVLSDYSCSGWGLLRVVLGGPHAPCDWAPSSRMHSCSLKGLICPAPAWWPLQQWGQLYVGEGTGASSEGGSVTFCLRSQAGSLALCALPWHWSDGYDGKVLSTFGPKQHWTLTRPPVARVLWALLACPHPPREVSVIHVNTYHLLVVIIVQLVSCNNASNINVVRC